MAIASDSRNHGRRAAADRPPAGPGVAISLTDYNRLRIAGLVVAVLLLALAFYSGSFATPYVTSQDSPKYAHTIVPETSPLYEEYTADYDHDVYQYDQLSPTGQELVDRTLAAPPRPQYNNERRFVPDVCREFLLVCDTYAQDELPTQFTYGTELDYEEAFVFIEEGEDRYLLRTGWTSHAGLFALPFRFVIAWLTLIPLGLFVAYVSHKAESDRVLAGTIGGGISVALLAVLVPYLHMAGLIQARAIGVLVLGAVWLSMIGAAVYRMS